jgi:hypothetical protein
MIILKLYDHVGLWEVCDTEKALMELQLWHPNTCVKALLDDGQILVSPYAMYKQG